MQEEGLGFWIVVITDVVSPQTVNREQASIFELLNRDHPEIFLRTRDSFFKNFILVIFDEDDLHFLSGRFGLTFPVSHLFLSALHITTKKFHTQHES